ncbi:MULTISPECIES: DNA polymerase I [Aerococcus]|uniref:DNA polymerase I n=1 Tax=Aerococcus tenax TaxID=3078812 RepID=A0A5N1BUP8_9LACT|nr:DNA polymerase I [Aerococcus urinae]KAA9242704.1 DNA polymerase I [Aerococcus urinae]MDK6370894.1 DNA polymerase I [Aerococcus urinae]MDK6597265.1 DNA polymerase I [Aerococcus urinae]MDK7301899.1 DNA polymerase I [Aerococcus urinae]MDK7801150.1 DNA polymerase I [Aerococcus urinae]
MSKQEKLLLFDGSSLAFRAFFAMHDLNRFKNNKGLHTNALYAFHLMLTHVLEKEKPSHALVAWDAGKITFRTAYYPEYKGGRDKTPQEFVEQMPYFNKLLDAFGIAHYELANYEADDIIGTLSQRGAEAGMDVVIISGDKDLIQLARDQVRVDINRKGVTNIDSYTPQSIQADQGISPEQLIDVKGLMGDNSDNYPGVTGIGEKTALKLIQEFGSMEEVYANIDQVSGKKRKENLVKDKDQAFLSKKLARIILDAPVEKSLADLKCQGIQAQDLVNFYREMNFKQFMEKFLANSGPDADFELEDSSWEVPDYQVLDQLEAKHFTQDQTALYLEMFENNYHEGELIYVVWGNKDHIYLASPDLVRKSQAFKNWIEDPHAKKVLYDAKRSQVILKGLGMDLAGVSDDVLIASYLIHARDLSGDVANVAREFNLDYLAYDSEVYGKGKKMAVPEDKTRLYDHLVAKVSVINDLLPIIKDRLEADEMVELYRKIELPLAQVLAKMEIMGISVDRSRLVDLSQSYEEQLDQLQEEIYREAGVKFNINSTQQLSKILFEDMGLKGGKKTKSGNYSTAQSELEKLQGVPIIDLILAYRQLAKLQSTYVQGILDYIHQDGKVHSRFIQTLTTTGRLSSADPNLQNIPIRTEEGRKIRQAFVPSHPDWVIFSSDYSQIELRVLAHVSGDPHLQEAFKENKDIHTATAAKVFHKDEKDISKDERRQAKAVNFGIVYGISDYGLSQNLSISRQEAKAFIDKYFEIYPKVAEYMDKSVEIAREAGYAKTLFNRRRYLPDLKAKNYNVRSFAERTAMNSPIQGTAADIIKVAMVEMDQALKEHQLQANLLLQVHDELIFEVAKEDLEDLAALVKDVMENAVSLEVPLIVDSNYGSTWYDAK